MLPTIEEAEKELVSKAFSGCKVAEGAGYWYRDGSFNVVTACQCFMYFDKDSILPKIHQMLKMDGHFAVLFMAWLPEESKIARTSGEMVLKYNPAWTGGHMRRWMEN